MNSTMVTAMAATLGSFAGAAAFIARTWIGHYRAIEGNTGKVSISMRNGNCGSV
jgi:hypothetical protein